MKKIAVIGSGVMGAGIAAHIANSGVEVLLFDIAKDGIDKNIISKAAIDKMLLEPSPLTHNHNQKLITACNLDDDLPKLQNVDWVIEAIVEKLDIKQSLYSKLQKYCNKDTIISSNTSTILLSELTKNFDQDFKDRFLITHFFNPPRFMRLLEIVTSNNFRKDLLNKIETYADIHLGKQIVKCNDTPGFIANRIGCYWLEVGLREAIKLGININDADAILGKFFGIPKTGIFGLFDLIGIDVMKLIATSLTSNLPNDDDFCQNYTELSLINNMIKDGYIGRKGKGGFYRMITANGMKKREILDLQTEQYKDEDQSTTLKSLNAKTLQELLASDDIGSKYALNIMSKTFIYAANLLPSVTDNIVDIDIAMKLGFNWKYGIFELIDQFVSGEISGAAYIKSKLEAENREVPRLFNIVGNNSFYKEQNNQIEYFINNTYSSIPKDLNKIHLSGIKQSNKPIYQNNSSAIWNIGDDVICFELTSKMGALDSYIFESLENACSSILKNYRGMVITNDSHLFSAGANLKFILELAESKKFIEIEKFIKQGQSAMLAVKNANIPIVTAVKNLALGGGCELIMHSKNSQNYIETYAGLVEVNVGLIPAWGGCKEMILRSSNANELAESFQNILLAITSKSAIYAKNMRILKSDNVTMNIDRLLSDAKKQILDFKIMDNLNDISFSGKESSILQNAFDIIKEKLSPYDKIIGNKLLEIFSSERNEIKIMQKELEIFMELISNKLTQDRIEYMINNGKALKN